MLSLYDVNLKSNEIKRKYEKMFHKGPMTCFDMENESHNLVTVGEDGMINVINLNNLDDSWTVHASENCLNAVKFISSKNFIAASHSCEIQIWDNRSNSKVPSKTHREHKDVLDVERRVWSIDINPAKPWLICCAVSGPNKNLDPSIIFYDVRASTTPVMLNNSIHNGHVWQANFHPKNPDFIVSSSSDGSLALWNTYNSFSNDSNSNDFNVQLLRNSDLDITSFDIDNRNDMIISTSEVESITFNSEITLKMN